MTTRPTAPVSQRALIQRINRVLAKDNQHLKAARGRYWRSSLGDYYIVDPTKNFMVETKVSLEALGRKLDCLQPWERLVEAP
jgi:hypothetical protein